SEALSASLGEPRLASCLTAEITPSARTARTEETMKTLGTPLRLTLCLRLLAAIALGLPASASAAGPPSGINVTVTNTPLPVQGTVDVGNFPATAAVHNADDPGRIPYRENR